MATDFKNVTFKFVKITGGNARVDSTMTEKAFYQNKPQGIYRCFIFPNAEFGGVDYSDLQNLISIEKSNMWDKNNRNTFLGFNEETNNFVVNHSAWLSAKDTDLKTDGELEHAGQAGWFTTTLNATKGVNSKYELLQTDGSKIYLELKPITQTSSEGQSKFISGHPSCVEHELKSVLNQPLYRKNDALFAKCANDNSVVMVHDCVPVVTAGSGASQRVADLFRNNKEYGFSFDYQSKTYHYTYSCYKFGKKIFSFENSSSISSLNNNHFAVKAINKTTNTDIELTYTSNISDILSSGEALTFNTLHKQKGFRFIYNKTDTAPWKQKYLYYYAPLYFGTVSTKLLEFSLYSDKTKATPECDLISCDSRKPFMYTGIPTIVNEMFRDYQSIKISEFMPNIPDGIVVLVVANTTGTNPRKIIVRLKNGDPVKYKQVTFTNETTVVNITGATMFGVDLYSYSNELFQKYSISKDDVVNGTGFTNLESSITYLLANYGYSTVFTTIYKI